MTTIFNLLFLDKLIHLIMTNFDALPDDADVLAAALAAGEIEDIPTTRKGVEEALANIATSYPDRVRGVWEAK